MLDKQIFFKGVEKLGVEYTDRGFVMTKEKATQWYEYMKDLTENQFNKKIEDCLKTCRRVPYMADVLGLKEDDINPIVNSGARRIIE